MTHFFQLDLLSGPHFPKQHHPVWDILYPNHYRASRSMDGQLCTWDLYSTGIRVPLLTCFASLSLVVFLNNLMAAVVTVRPGPQRTAVTSLFKDAGALSTGSFTNVLMKVSCFPCKGELCVTHEILTMEIFLLNWLMCWKWNSLSPRPLAIRIMSLPGEDPGGCILYWTWRQF